MKIPSFHALPPVGAPPCPSEIVRRPRPHQLMQLPGLSAGCHRGMLLRFRLHENRRQSMRGKSQKAKTTLEAILAVLYLRQRGLGVARQARESLPSVPRLVGTQRGR